MKKSLVFGILLFFLGILALLAPTLTLIGLHSSGSISQFEVFLRDYQNSVTAVGTLLLISSLAILQVFLINSSSERRDKASRRLAAQMKLADFRQIWINELREDLASAAALAYKKIQDRLNDSELDTAPAIIANIQLRMNREDKEFNPLTDALKLILVRKIDEDQKERLAEIVRISQRILKNEWERLKSDLERDKR